MSHGPPTATRSGSRPAIRGGRAASTPCRFGREASHCFRLRVASTSDGLGRTPRALADQWPARPTWSGRAGRNSASSRGSTGPPWRICRQTARLFCFTNGARSTRSAVVYLRTADGSDAVRLGDGKAWRFHPTGDGHWHCRKPRANSSYSSRRAPARSGASGRRSDGFLLGAIVSGRTAAAGGRRRCRRRARVVHSAHGDGPTGSDRRQRHARRAFSPEGRRVLVNDPLEGYLVWPLDGGDPVALTRSTAGTGRFSGVRMEVPLCEGSEGSVVRIHRFNLATGKSDLVKEIAPQDPSGVIGVAAGRGELAVTPDGQELRVHVLGGDREPVSRRGTAAVMSRAPLDRCADLIEWRISVHESARSQASEACHEAQVRLMVRRGCGALVDLTSTHAATNRCPPAASACSARSRHDILPPFSSTSRPTPRFQRLRAS